jgi:hypothetical protein
MLYSLTEVDLRSRFFLERTFPLKVAFDDRIQAEIKQCIQNSVANLAIKSATPSISWATRRDEQPLEATNDY